jgi:hypothetical protein
MNFPLGLWDIGLWLAIASIILLITSEMLSQRYGKINIRLNKKRLRNASLAVSTLFLATVALRVIDIILTL